MTSTLLQALFERYALVSLEKQEYFYRALGEHTRELDLDEGIARFSNGLTCPFQVLGTESDNTLTWLWGWADEQSEVDARLLASCRELRAWAEKEQLPEFLSPSLDLNIADGAVLSLAASALCKATAYYRDQYEGGSLFLLLFCDGSERNPGFDRQSFLRRFNELAQTRTVDLRNVMRSYFQERGLPVVENPGEISGELLSGERLIAGLDEQGRIITMNGEPFSSGAAPAAEN